MNKLNVVVVTGATGGIGRAICSALSKDCYAVIAHFHRDEAGADLLQAELHREGAICHVAQADLSAPDGARSLARTAKQLLADHPDYVLHGLVNNAGVMIGPSWESISTEQFDRFMTVNARAPFFLAQELVPVMRSGGSIVNISSASAHISSPGNIAYAMSKAANESLTRNLAAALAPVGVRVNAVVPGYTDNGHSAFRDARALEYMSSFSPLGGVGTPSTVADAVTFLLSSRASRTTGSLLDVSGGTTLSPRGSQIRSISELAE